MQWTGANYVSALKFVCTQMGVSTEWHDGRIHLLLKGTARMNAGTVAARLKVRCILTELQVERTVMLADALEQGEFATFLLTAWASLARVQS